MLQSLLGAAGNAPSCCMSEKRFATPQCSTIWPLRTRMAFSVRRPSGLRRVIDEIRREQFLEHGKVSSALDFFGVAAHDRLCCIA
jgi:hypothetical protein